MTKKFIKYTLLYTLGYTTKYTEFKMEEIKKLKMKEDCKHNESYPMYARQGLKWVSTQKILGYMVHVCVDCGAFVQVETSKKEII